MAAMSLSVSSQERMRLLGLVGGVRRGRPDGGRGACGFAQPRVCSRASAAVVGSPCACARCAPACCVLVCVVGLLGSACLRADRPTRPWPRPSRGARRISCDTRAAWCRRSRTT
jgi:hypothetical protein